MTTLDSSVVSITIGTTPGATDFTKSEVDKGSIVRSSTDGLHSFKHFQSTTSKGRRRAVARLEATDPVDNTIVCVCTLTADFPVGSNTYMVDVVKAITQHMNANSYEEVPILVAGHNYG